MKHKLLRTYVLLTGLVCASFFVTAPQLAQAQQVPIPRTASQVPGPPPGTAMTTTYVQMVGRIAYVWGWPLVNMANRIAAIAKVPEPGLLGGALPVAYNRLAMLTGYIAPDERFVTCPNQDVVYATGWFNLDNGPIVFQVPDFGDRFWVYALYDARTDEFSEIGKQYGTKPGFYLMVGPNWTGNPPPGITAVVRSSTNNALAAPRIFMEDTPEDHAAIQQVVALATSRTVSDAHENSSRRVCLVVHGDLRSRTEPFSRRPLPAHHRPAGR
jgi:hypothetical protein